MCGIVGMVTRDGLSDRDRTEVAALATLMDRRGPDDTGSWDDGKVCALGFRRLSILDLSPRGHQPMVSGDGAHVVVFNGEVVNFGELRTELEALGHRFVSTSDTEVVLNSLIQWDTEALARFNGMFALAWYRPGPQRLVLARDPVGIKPLSWWWSPEAFVFGSGYDQVVRHRRCRRERIDPHALELYLRLGYLPAPYALIEGTGQVRPGHLVEVMPGRPPRSRPFRALAARDGTGPEGDPLTGGAADDAVAEAVAHATRRQMVSDVEVGSFLSGGIDSPLVTANMAATIPAGGAPGPIRAFTIGTADPASDESAAAATYAHHLGVEHVVRVIEGADALALLDDVAHAYTEPFGDYSSLPTLLVSSLAADHVKVVLSGDGGDELFWGYPRFDKVRRARKWFTLPRPVRMGAYALTKPMAPQRRPARGIMFDTIGDWYLDAHSGLRTRDFARISPTTQGLPADFGLFRLDRVPDEAGLMWWMRANELACHLPMILNKVDRASMFHSLEVRVPLCDLEVVDLAARIGPDRQGGAKGVLRRALAQRVPADAIPLPKKGFTVPLDTWLRTDLRPIVSELLLERDPFPGGFFDRAGLAAFYADHAEGRLDLTRGLWHLLALQLWARTHLRPLESS